MGTDPDNRDTINPRASWQERVSRGYRKVVEAVDAPLLGPDTSAREGEAVEALLQGQPLVAVQKRAKAFGAATRHVLGADDKTPTGIRVR